MTAAQERRLLNGDGAEVAGRVRVASSAWQRFVGLMGRTRLADGEGLYIRPCNAIHMFFMRIPIDVAFVDAHGTVLRVYGSIKPWRVSRIVFGAKAAIELPAGTLERHGVARGSRLELG